MKPLSFKCELKVSAWSQWCRRMSSGGRSLVKIIFTNFLKSLSPKAAPKGNLIGKDDFGNTYFEVPADPQRGKHKPSRWFKTKVHETFDQEIPVEWEAWLRGRRTKPPSPEEINQNVALARLKSERGREIQEKDNEYFQQKQLATGKVEPEKASFPQYPEYHTGDRETAKKN